MSGFISQACCSDWLQFAGVWPYLDQQSLSWLPYLLMVTELVHHFRYNASLWCLAAASRAPLELPDLAFPWNHSAAPCSTSIWPRCCTKYYGLCCCAVTHLHIALLPWFECMSWNELQKMMTPCCIGAAARLLSEGAGTGPDLSATKAAVWGLERGYDRLPFTPLHKALFPCLAIACYLRSVISGVLGKSCL